MAEHLAPSVSALRRSLFYMARRSQRRFSRCAWCLLRAVPRCRARARICRRPVCQLDPATSARTPVFDFFRWSYDPAALTWFSALALGSYGRVMLRRLSVAAQRRREHRLRRESGAQARVRSPLSRSTWLLRGTGSDTGRSRSVTASVRGGYEAKANDTEGMPPIQPPAIST